MHVMSNCTSFHCPIVKILGSGLGDFADTYAAEMCGVGSQSVEIHGVDTVRLLAQRTRQFSFFIEPEFNIVEFYLMKQTILSRSLFKTINT